MVIVAAKLVIFKFMEPILFERDATHATSNRIRR